MEKSSEGGRDDGFGGDLMVVLKLAGEEKGRGCGS